MIRKGIMVLGKQFHQKMVVLQGCTYLQYAAHFTWLKGMIYTMTKTFAKEDGILRCWFKQ